jgi:hypothetical protein
MIGLPKALLKKMPMSPAPLVFISCLILFVGALLFFFLYHLPNRKDDERLDEIKRGANKKLK